MYDISNIEFKKNGNEPSLIKRDGAKVLNEGKAILNKLVEECLKAVFSENAIVKEADMLKNTSVKDSSEFGSQSTIEDKYFLKQCYTIPDKAVKWSKVNDGFYES
ncbi:hypothetical protein RO3G_11012 [Rhizopus delemar RA 99-880]|uniref:Uncharacterized protein n=1 Tax=Rhizopus delemar (strain RA 99-880 / ATCC MYA-4621 / FGSC 9543 / NRRL 43880) TaxID=246409 RepID=I1CCX1_RHIO9|nr:hypothetical protein RO3G_11012 [Rhizopus delemar RA 99-880]|eukprot:EIE86301.1 hypothetical protein RO3G_11012 [Rhizopus delemar RA 99-880]